MSDDDEAQSRSGTAADRREARRGGGSRQRQTQIQDEIAERYGVDRDEVRVRGTQQGIERELTEAGATTAAETTREHFAQSDFVEPDDVDVDVQRQGARVDARIPEDRQQTVAERAREELTDSPVVTEQDVDVEVGERGVEEAGLTEEGEERVEQRQEALEQIAEADIEPTARGQAIDTPDAEILRRLSQMGDTPGEILDDSRTFSTNAPGLGDAAGFNISVYRSKSRRGNVGGISFEDRSEVRDVLEAAAELPDRTLAELDDEPLFAGTGEIARERAERRGRRQAREQARDAFDDIDDIDPAGIDARADGRIIVQDEAGRTRTGDSLEAAAEGAVELEREQRSPDIPDADATAARTERDIDVGVEDVEQELRDRAEDDVERIRVRERGDGLVGAATTEAGETQVVGVGVDDETTRAFAEDIQESRRERQRRNVAEQFDEDLGGVDIDEGHLVEVEDEEGGEITLGLDEDVRQEAAVAQAAEEFEQFDEDDLETFEEDDGGFGVRPEESAVREQLREDVADDVPGADTDDVEVRETADGQFEAEVDESEISVADRLGVDDDQEPGRLASALGSLGEGARLASPGRMAAVSGLAAGLRTESGLPIPGTDGRTTPGKRDVDAATDAIEPATETIDDGIESTVDVATEPFERGAAAIGEQVDVEDMMQVGPTQTVAAAVMGTEAGRTGATDGVETGLQAMNPAAIAEDGIRLSEMGIRAADTATRSGAGDDIQTALDVGEAASEIAVDQGTTLATAAAAEQPSRLVEAPVAAATIGTAGIALGAGAQGAARTGRRLAREGPQRARSARRGLSSEVRDFRRDRRGMAGGERMRTRERQREITPDEVDDATGTTTEFTADELQMRRAREEMPPRDAFDGDAAFARELERRVARRRLPDADEYPSRSAFENELERAAARIDADEMLGLRTGQRQRTATTVDTRTQTQAAAAAAPMAALGATAFAARETREATAQADGFATPGGMTDEVSVFDQPTATMQTEGLALGQLDETTVTDTTTAERQAFGQPTTQATAETQTFDQPTTTMTAEGQMFNRPTQTTRPPERPPRSPRPPNFDVDDGGEVPSQFDIDAEDDVFGTGIQDAEEAFQTGFGESNDGLGGTDDLFSFER